MRLPYIYNIFNIFNASKHAMKGMSLKNLSPHGNDVTFFVVVTTFLLIFVHERQETCWKKESECQNFHIMSSKLTIKVFRVKFSDPLRCY